MARCDRLSSGLVQARIVPVASTRHGPSGTLRRMSNASSQSDPLDRACALVGRFLYHFGRVEQKVDQAIIKLLDLDEKVAPAVTGSIDFFRKVNLVRASAHMQASTEESEKFADNTCKDVFKINDERQVIAHSSFAPTPEGAVQFSRTVTKEGRVRVVDPVWTEATFKGHYAEMTRLEAKLDRLIQVIKPSEVPFDWFLPWQDVYHRSSSAALLAATTGLTQPMGQLDQGR
jgi:hypothetical protein